MRDKTIPAEHLHTDSFLPKWKELCINHGLAVMGLIVDEEKTQLTTIHERIEESARSLETFKNCDEFTKQNEILKKEIEKAQLNLKITKQGKFQRDLADFEKDEVFDLTIRHGRSKSQRRGHRQQSRQRRNKSQSESDEEISKTVIFSDQEGAEPTTERTPPPKIKTGLKNPKPPKATQERTFTRSQKRQLLRRYLDKQYREGMT